MVPTPKHVLITGGSRGIGLSIAQLFAKNAYRCTLVSRSESNLQRALQTLTPLSPSPSPDHSTIAGDISSPTFWSAAQLGAALKSQSVSTSQSASQSASQSRSNSNSSSKIDVLVNCAGITHSALFSATAPEDMQAVVDTNLTSLMLGTRFLLRSRFIGGGSAKRGSVAASASADEGASGASEADDFSPVIINVASLLGLQGGYGAVAYAASKAGVLGFTRALAGEYVSHRVRVNAVVPGYVETDMTKGWSYFFYLGFSESLFYQTMAMGWERERERQADVFPDLNTAALQDKIPLKRFGRPEEIAQAALFLAQNQYAHNCVINVDGGLSAV
jgi:NAD(P)-dependent dehydrogenase (short-subunit alcohol dehydrogenase family)